jgi:hypothetical protein
VVILLFIGCRPFRACDFSCASDICTKRVPLGSTHGSIFSQTNNAISKSNRSAHFSAKLAAEFAAKLTTQLLAIWSADYPTHSQPLRPTIKSANETALF